MKPDPRLRTSMALVLLACLPGLLTLLWLQGWGLLCNLLLCASAALLCEALLLKLRGEPVSLALTDGSALVTAVLLAAALPTLAPWWLPMVAAGTAIGIGKQAFGGVGRNLFNPAMLGYAFVLLSFPLQMNHWPGQPAGLFETLQQVFGGAEHIDAWAQPTLLDGLRHNRSLTIDELFASHPGFGSIGGRGAEWANLAFLLGGLFLLQVCWRGCRCSACWPGAAQVRIPMAPPCCTCFLARPCWPLFSSPPSLSPAPEAIGPSWCSALLWAC